jgi:phosphoglucosamine mutase
MRFFGSSGIRGRFGELIAPEFVCRVGQAVGNLYDDVIVGWDARTTSPLLADAAVAGLLGAGCSVHVAGMVSTPTLAHAARRHKAGIMITASHNPPTDNGIKLWNPDGSGFGTTQMLEVEDMLVRERMPSAPWDRVHGPKAYERAIEEHIAAISSRVGRLDGKVVVDCGNGAASTITPYLLSVLGCEVITLNGHPDGSFPGRGSEPTEESTRLLGKCVVEAGARVGIAHDGDGDRMVAVDERGNFAGGDALMPLMCKLEARTKVVVPVNASMAVDRYLEGIEIVRCRVGDVYVSEKIKETGADFGAEPSGTWVFPGMSYCPEGIYAAARLVQLASEEPLSERLAGIPRFCLRKKRLDMAMGRGEEVMGRVAALLVSRKPEAISDMDGVRADFGEGWILLRPSGTEPKLKIVAEAEDEESADRLMAVALEIAKEALG